MVTAPAGELFVLELPIFVVERIGENGVGEHILFPNFTHDLHEHLLELNKVLNVVNGELSVRELHSAEQRFQIRTVKDGDVGKGGLINP